jgi:hypothetical protein
MDTQAVIHLYDSQEQLNEIKPVKEEPKPVKRAVKVGNSLARGGGYGKVGIYHSGSKARLESFKKAK